MQNVLPLLILPQRNPHGAVLKPLPWGCWLFGPDAPGVDLGDLGVFVQEDQVRVLAGGNYTLIPPMNHRRYIA